MLSTIPKWNYGHTITEDNQSINFDDGTGELLGLIEIGSYTLSGFANAVANAMTAASVTQAYSVNVDRTDNSLIISADGNFSLLIDTGAQKNISAFSLMGFSGLDLSGTNSYQGAQSGSSYIPQFYLDKFVNFDDKQKAANSSINQSASGTLEVIKYGQLKFMECNIIPVTNVDTGLIIKGASIRSDNQGVEKLRDFLEYATTKAPLEFVPDELNSSDNIRNCVLESTTEDRNATGFFLRELYTSLGANWFESGKLTFRELI